MKELLKSFWRKIQKIIRKIKLSFYIFGYRKKTPYIAFSDIKSIALLRWDGKLGDAIMMGAFISLLEYYRPDIKITILVSGLPTQWIKKISNRVNILPCDKRSRKTAKYLQQFSGEFDAVLDLSSEFSYKEFLALKNLQANMNIGYGLEKHTIYDVKIPNEKVNVKERYIYSASLFIPKDMDDLYLRDIKLPIPKYNSVRYASPSQNQIAINFFGATIHRQFSYFSIKKFINNWLLEWPEDVIVLLPIPGFIPLLQQVVNEIGCDRLILPQNIPSMELSLGILSASEICFTPDTSVVHMASCLNTPTLAIYSADEKNYQEWKPLASKNAVIFNPPPTYKNEKVKVDNFSWNEVVAKRNGLLCIK